MSDFIIRIGICQAFCLVLLLKGSICAEECILTPLGSKTEALPADNLFAIDIEGVDEEYIPTENYTIRLFSRSNKTTFIAFTIFATGDTKDNEDNPRRRIPLQAGRVVSSLDSSSDTVFKPGCTNTLSEFDLTPKTSVKALWIAPGKENKCVTIRASVAIKPDVWYSWDGPLSKRVCENQRKLEDMPPKENDNCTVCEEARYEVNFDGTWSYNTHPRMFPGSRELARFSDVVGASHSKSYYLYKLNSDAGPGLKSLAEQGNTTELELDILKQLNYSVRTLIKATGPPKPNMSTIASFRASRDKHLLSLVSAIMPSPDWFLGVSSLELCDASTNRWAEHIRLNLYPLDAGTDTGLTFEAANDNTSPAKAISSAIIDKDIPKESIKPFAKLRIDLVRTYSTPECITEQETLTDNEDGDVDEENKSNEDENKGSDEVEEPTRRRPVVPSFSEAPPPLPVDTEAGVEDCPMSSWGEWLDCEGPCEGGKRSGYHSRTRFLVAEPDQEQENQNCLKYDSEIEECEEECEEPTEEPDTEAESQ